MKVAVVRRRYELRRPFSTAHGVIADRSGFLFTVENQGTVGRGEALPLPSFGTESIAACEAALRAFHLEELPSTLAQVELATAPFHSTPTARFAIECALLEFLARRKGVSVARLLAKEPRRAVAVGALVSGERATDLARSAADAVDEGYRTVKVKVGSHPLAVDAQRLLEVRRAIGAKVRLRVDANGAWSEAQALSALRGLTALELEMCEQPVPATDVDGLRRLRGRVRCAVAADEALLTAEGRAAVLAPHVKPAADVVVLKPAALGGLLPALAFARRALEAGIGCFVTSMIDGSLGRAAALHLACAIPDDGFAHGIANFHGLIDDGGLKAHAGALVLPEGAGFG